LMADEAVGCQPVSDPDSLLTGKFTGNFAESDAESRFWRPVGEQIQRLAAKFPTQRNREFFSKNREFSRQNRELDLGRMDEFIDPTAFEPQPSV
jgi:phosphoenolpyruvate carboxylase